MPRKWDKRLAWWLNLANLFPPIMTDRMLLEGESMPSRWQRRPIEVSGVAATVLRLEPSDCKPFGLERLFHQHAIGADECAYKLGETAHSILTGLSASADILKGRGRLLLHGPGPDGGGIVTAVKDGRIQLWRIDPLSSLCTLLNNRSVHVVGQCPICGRLFERLRRDQECDTSRCRDSDRKRAYRKAEYEENRKVNRLVRTGMALNEAKAQVQIKSRKPRVDR